ncbi:hypothetical protein BS78_01G021600 [Paspalum vaginatum]|nr:hypothetical protein BS78_01G021600 [Paspalum vaginatum]
MADNEPSGVAPVAGFPVTAGQWSSGLFDCFDDCDLCCMTFWCPCVTFGRMAEIVDGGAPSCVTSGALYTVIMLALECQWIYSCTYRSKMRTKFNLPETPCGDCGVHFFCEPCALTQHYRELTARGFDPALGWDANARRAAANGAGAAATMYPPAGQWMGR